MIEYFDVLTEQGTPTGQVLPAHEVHAQGLWHGSVHAWVVNSVGQLLLAQRALTKKTHPGTWDMAICGHISTGEDAIMAVQREGFEELGIIIDDSAHERLLTYVHHNEDVLPDGSIRHERLITPTLLIREDVDLARLSLEPTEVAAVRWIVLSELFDDLSRSDHPYAIRPDEWQQLFPLLQEHIT